MCPNYLRTHRNLSPKPHTNSLPEEGVVRYAWCQGPSGGWVCLIPGPSWEICLVTPPPNKEGTLPGKVHPTPEDNPPVLTSSGGHRSRRYASYWNAFLYHINLTGTNKIQMAVVTTCHKATNRKEGDCDPRYSV